MKYARNILIMLLCVAVGLIIGKSFLWVREKYYPDYSFQSNDRPNRLTGMGDAPDVRGFVLRHVDSQSLGPLIGEWKNAFATAVGIEYGPDLTQPALTQACKTAHDAGFSVVLLPPGASPKNPYGRPLPQIAQEAETAGVDHFVISWLNQDSDASYWRSESAAVRKVFHGTVILGASHEFALRVDCWDATDVIGIIGPIPFARLLPSAPEKISETGLRSAWSCTLAGWDSMADYHKKKLAYLRCNVPVAVSHKLPPAGVKDEPTLNPGLQAMMYETLLLETKSPDSRIQMLLFDWGVTGDVNTLNQIGRNLGMMKKVAAIWAPEPETQAATQTATTQKKNP